MHFKDEKEAPHKKVALFFKFYSPKVKPTSRNDVTAHLQYEVTGLELNAWLETLSWQLKIPARTTGLIARE